MRVSAYRKASIKVALVDKTGDCGKDRHVVRLCRDATRKGEGRLSTFERQILSNDEKC